MKMVSEVDGHRLTFDEGSHVYMIDGKRPVSVTTFVKGGWPTGQGLINWQIAQGSLWTSKIIRRLLRDNPHRIFTPTTLEELARRSKFACEKPAKAAANIGTLVHDVAYHLELSGKIPDDLKAKIEASPDKAKVDLGVSAFVRWHKENSDELVASESIVASITHFFSGKFDRLARRAGKLILSDFKTANGIYLDQFLQLGAYVIAIREWLKLEVQGIEILRFGKDGEFQPLLVDKPEEIRAFEAGAIRCRQNYELRKLENDKRWKYGGEKLK